MGSKVVKGTDTTKDDVRAFKKYVCKEFNGKGDITFEDGAKYTVNFDIYIFNSGGLAGSILFTTIDSRLDDELNHSQIFTVSGEAQNSNGLMISAEQCTFYSINTIENNVSIPLITGNFKITRLKVYDDKKIKKIDEPESTVQFEFGVLNYFSTTKFLLKTEIGEIQNINILSDNENCHFQEFVYSFYFYIVSSKHKKQKSLEDIKQDVFNVINKVLELTSFALTTEHRWSYYKIFHFDSSFQRFEFAYSEAINQLPRPPESHNKY